MGENQIMGGISMNWYKLRVLGMRDVSIRHLMKGTKRFDDIFKLDDQQLRKYFKLDDSDIDKLNKIHKINMDEEISILMKHKVKVINLKSAEYPEDLKNISQSPLFLYYKGNIKLLNTRKIAVVGTRKATGYGKMACERITEGLVDAGITTVSGLALGIDAICHNRTLEKKGSTVAVIGSGMDVIYPRINRGLWEKIEKEGLIISEYPLGTEPTNFNFPMRNRIIVGISRGVVVVESQERGGSLITAGIALEESRDVFAIPGDMFSPSSQGCNTLIKRSQAKLITDVQDIFDEYGWSGQKEDHELPKLTEEESKIYGDLVKERTLDELIISTGYKASDLLSMLMEMEIKGATVSVGGGRYRRKI